MLDEQQVLVSIYIARHHLLRYSAES